ncbi:carboxymuconolactone decarboxylase family protein [Dactylosporangium sp. NPDC048998]|uniref:carboxymuconolactone decarboxylase family protein n=1 Tax=Dactylosporangium sp. NPDC048998 TaxID=3363976 RepID=UPI003718B4B6
MSSPYRFVVPVPRRAATGSVAEVYARSARELGALFAPHLSVVPELHAALWAVLRESLLVGAAPRHRKEAVAAAVAVANRCPFCIDAHTAMLHATGEHRLASAVLRGDTPEDPADAALVAWAMSTRRPSPRPWPFPPELAPEYVGTALANHCINRLVDALRPGSPLPGGALRDPSRRAAGLALSRTVRRTLPLGESLSLLTPAAGGATSAAGEPAWAAGAPVGTAWVAFSRASKAGGALLGDAARDALLSAVDAWDGEHPELGNGWLDRAVTGVPEDQLPAARLAVLAAIAPYRLTDSAVAAWRSSVGPDGAGRSDADLVRLLAYGAFTAVDRLAAAVSHADGGRPASLSTG